MAPGRQSYNALAHRRRPTHPIRRLPPGAGGSKPFTMTRRTVLLEALSSTTNDISRLIRPLDGVDLNWPADPDYQPPGDIIGHLVATEKIYQDHIRLLLTGGGRILFSNGQSNSPCKGHTPIDQLNRDFQQARSETLQTLEALGPGEWQKVAHLEPHGRISLRFLMQRLVEHDIEHTARLVESVHFWRALQKNGGLVQ